MKPNISVITVCLNAEKTIERTIESILNQSYTDFEYIIVDGKSNDTTLEIIKSYEEKFKKKNIAFRWVSESDKGIYDAMNKGISIARGELIGILGSDDWYESDALKQIATTLKKSNPDFIHGKMKLYSQSSKLIKELKPGSKKEMIKRMAFFHPTCFIKRKVYRELNGYSLEYEISSDYDLILRVLKGNYTIAYTDAFITNFSSGGVSTTKVKQALLESHLIRVDNNYNKFLSSYFYYRALIIYKLRTLNEN